jgi:hypothetical protein
MNEQSRVPTATLETLSPIVHEIVRHLCEGDCHTYGVTLEWCETRTRGDCTYAVQCPGCTTQFIVDEDDLAALERWTEAHGHELVCGIR